MSQLLDGTIFGGADIQKFDATFGRSRKPQAIWQLLASANKTQDSRVVQAFNTYFFSVLHDTFEEQRYDVARNLHLEAVSKSKPDLLKAWRAGLTMNLDDTILGVGNNFDARAWLITKVLTDGHLDRWLTFSLRAYLQPGVQAPKQPEQLTGDDVKIAEKLTELCKGLADAQALTQTEVALRELQTFFNSHNLHCELRHDVQSQLQSLRQSSQHHKNLQIVETDDPYHLLLCGDDVAGSCQRTDGNPELNKGLFGYLLNGQTRLVAVVDPQNRIFARALIRLLRIKGSNKWALFVERHYGDTRYEQAIISMAKRKATAMQLPLAAVDREGRKAPVLMSSGGLAPFEYSDASGGVQADSVFTIDNARYI